MGNSLGTSSSEDTTCVAVRSPDFSTYCTQQWRSDRVRELDTLGGGQGIPLHRPQQHVFCVGVGVGVGVGAWGGPQEYFTRGLLL